MLEALNDYHMARPTIEARADAIELSEAGGAPYIRCIKGVNAFIKLGVSQLYRCGPLRAAFLGTKIFGFACQKKTPAGNYFPSLALNLLCDRERRQCCSRGRNHSRGSGNGTTIQRRGRFE